MQRRHVIKVVAGGAAGLWIPAAAWSDILTNHRDVAASDSPRARILRSPARSGVSGRTRCASMKVDDPRCDPMWEACGALDLPVAMHAEAFFAEHLRASPERAGSPL
jgi:hypothetical protein